jgi:carboxyl-terminal processing protease
VSIALKRDSVALPPCRSLPRRLAGGGRVWLFLAILAIALAGCQTSQPAVTEMGEPAEGALTSAVFDVGFDRIAEVYYQPVSMAQVTHDGLAGLSAIDDGLTAERREDTLLLFDGERLVGAYPLPDTDSPTAWVDLTMSAIADGRMVSPALREATSEDIYKAVFDGILAELDEYSRYLDAARAEQERASRDGYGGIGILLEFNEETGRGYVERVFDGAPAARAGIVAGEVFMEVDGRPTTGWDLQQLATELRGPIDSWVDITLLHPDGQVHGVRLQREQVIVNTVSAVIEDGVAILRVSRFNAATADDLAEALDETLEQLGPSARGIILDLRGNPGGLLGQSVAVADLFIRGGDIISTRGRHPDSLQRYAAASDDLAQGLPMVVLLDGRSASGAEIVAAALQDSGRAVVVGAASYGKGSVQTVTRLPNGGELFLTWSRLYSPAGITIHRQGVVPAICTSGETEDADRLVAQLRSGELSLPAELQSWRRVAPDDEAALAEIREVCPWEAHDEAFDIEVAERLLADPALFSEAMTVSGVAALAQL